MLNNNQLLNLEMQVINEGFWAERSLAYLCRTYDRLQRGRKYSELLPIHQIGILNFSLFPEEPSFYSHYKFLDTKTNKEYSRNLQISVLDLTQIKLATDDDRSCKIDYWAKLFKSKTWEEIRMLAEREPIFKEVATAVKTLTEEEKIRMQCEAREEYYRLQDSIQGKIADLEATLAEKDAKIAELEKQLAALHQK